MSDTQTIDILAGQIEALQRSKNNLARMLAGALEQCEECMAEGANYLRGEFGDNLEHLNDLEHEGEDVEELIV